MLTVNCPECGLAFETAARTNTRCHRCRKVVNVGRLLNNRAQGEVDAGADHASSDTDESGFPRLVLGVCLGAVGAYALWHGLKMRPESDVEAASFRGSRMWWCGFGAAATVVGVLLVVRFG